MSIRTDRRRFLILALAGICPCGATPGRAQTVDWSVPPEPGAPIAFEPPGVERLTLSNGIPVYVVSTGDIPLAQVTVVLRRGAYDDPLGSAGLASLTASALLAGAGTRSPAELADREAALGLDITATASRHGIEVGVNAPLAVLDDALALLSDVVERPRFDPDFVEDIKARRASLFSYLGGAPVEIANLLWRQAAYSPHHPYGRLTEGVPSHLEPITAEQLRRFHGAAAVDCSFIVVVGPVAGSEVLRVLDSRFGGMDGPVDDRRAPTPAGMQPRTRRGLYLVHRPGATQSIVRLAHLIPAGALEDRHALDVLNMVLGGSTTSRIGTTLRDERGLTYEARSEITLGREGGRWVGWANVAPEGVQDVIATFVAELHRARQVGPTASEIEEAKRHLLLAYPASFMTIRGTASMVVAELLEHGSTTSLGAWARGIEAVTASDIRRAATNYLRPDDLAVVVVGDTSGLVADLDPLDVGPITVTTADEVLELRAVPVAGPSNRGGP
jgi:zinc protease